MRWKPSCVRSSELVVFQLVDCFRRDDCFVSMKRKGSQEVPGQVGFLSFYAEVGGQGASNVTSDWHCCGDAAEHT